MARLNLLIIFLIFPFCIVGCQTTSVRYSPGQTINPKYFPIEVFDQNTIDWYTEHLVALEEPSLYELSKEDKQQCYRILVLPTFKAPICYRLIVFSNGTGLLIAKITNGKGGYEVGKLLKENQILLTKNQVDTFLSKLDKSGFWELPHEIDPIIERVDNEEFTSTDEDSAEVEIIMDTWSWVYEGVKNGSYHVVSNMRPDDDYRDVANYFFLLPVL